MWPNPQFPANLVTFTEEILNGKLHFFMQWYVEKHFHSYLVKTSKDYLFLGSALKLNPESDKAAHERQVFLKSCVKC